MGQKTAKIVESIYEGEWENPKYKTVLFYYQVILDNGDIGNVGVKEKGSRRIKKGAMIEYTIDDRNKIRLISSSNDPKVIAENALAKRSEKILGKPSMQRVRKHDEFLGFAWGYAKDLLIAGKTIEDIKNLPEIASFIYDEIGKMLLKDQIQDEQPEPIDESNDQSEEITEPINQEPPKEKVKKEPKKPKFKYFREELDNDQQDNQTPPPPITPVSDWFKDEDDY
jgi:hypothetical protein